MPGTSNRRSSLIGSFIGIAAITIGGAAYAATIAVPTAATSGVQIAQAAQPKGATPATPAPAADPRVRQAQQALANLKFNPGPIDGRLGPRTRAAIMDFQDARRLPKSGELDAATLQALNIR